MNILTYIYNQYLKYKNPDATLGFARFLIRGGLALLGAGVLWSLSINSEIFSLPVEIAVDSSNTSVTGVLMITVGLVMATFRVMTMNSRLTGLLVVHRGMEGMEVTAVQSALPKSFSKGRLDYIDLYEGHQLDQGKVFRPESALKAISNLPRQISSRLGEKASQEVKLAYAGLAPVPFLVAAGYVITSRQKCFVMDFKRGSGWHCLDAIDDGDELCFKNPNQMGNADIGVIISFSAEISEAQLPEGLRDYTYFVGLSNGARADSLNSEGKQLRVSQELYTFLANLKAKHQGIERVHIFMAAQASFSFRLGTIITASVHPAIHVYQYDP
ncbi:MAG: SAVED domain-containing protein, partial [Arenicella sp.]|nr:SAVED domain-containing protein [Arenicella sp.]